MTVINLASALVYTHNMTRQRQDAALRHGSGLSGVAIRRGKRSGALLDMQQHLFVGKEHRLQPARARAEARSGQFLARYAARFAHQSTEVFPGGGLYGVPLMFWGRCRHSGASIEQSGVFCGRRASKTPCRFRLTFAYIASIVVAVVLGREVAALEASLGYLASDCCSMRITVCAFGASGISSGPTARVFALSSGFLFLDSGSGRASRPALICDAFCTAKRTVRVPPSRQKRYWLRPVSGLRCCWRHIFPCRRIARLSKFSPQPDVVLAKSLLWCAGIGVVVWLFAFLAGIVGSRNFAGYFLGAVTLLFYRICLLASA